MRGHKTTVELDMEVLERARAVLGTTTIRDTLDAALREVDRFGALRRAADAVLEGGHRLATPGEVTRLRKPRR